MKKILTIITIFISFAAASQSIGINADGSIPNPSAILDVKSTTKGFLLPRMTNVQMLAIPTPAQGLLAFCTDCGSNGDYLFYKGSAWVALGSTTVGTANAVANANGATITNGVLSLSPADGTNPGIVTTSAQTIAGAKTFSADLTVNGITMGKGSGGIGSNTAIGLSALYSNTTGSFNTANGYQALLSNTTGSQNTANGNKALYSNTAGYQNTANGVEALYSNTTGPGNTATGSAALYSNTTGSDNTANGSGALYKNTTGYYNTADGYTALYSNTTGGNNTANGHNALFSNTIGYQNTANGSYTLQSNTSGWNNSAIGFYALYANTTGANNTAIGLSALSSNTTGDGNTGNGVEALNKNTTGFQNTAIGVSALYANTTGQFNTGNGVDALRSNTTGSFNTANGYQALKTNTTGSANTALGKDAGLGIVNGSNNVFLGSSSSATSDLSNAIAIGSRAIVTQSNAIQLGNSSITNVKTSGNISANGFAINGDPKPSAVVDLSNSVKGFLPPKLNNAQRNAINSPEIGLTIFNTDSNCIEFYLGEGWYNICTHQILTVANVSTNELENISETSVSAGLAISGDGGSPIIEYGICISSTNSIPTSSDRKVVFGNSAIIPSRVMNQITGLDNSTSYYLRGYAINSSGISYGIVRNFTTKNPVSTQLKNGLVAYYPFNGNANDASLNSFNGTVNGPILTSDRFGTANKAYLFGDNQEIIVPNTSNLNTYPLTVSLWYKTSRLSDGEESNIFSKYLPAYWNGFQIVLSDFRGANDGFGVASWYLRSISDRVIGYYNEGSFTQKFIVKDTWYHYVFVLDKTGGKIYVNGILIDSHSWTGTEGACSNNLLWKIGGKYNTWFNGKIDDIGIWNRALSPNEITYLFEHDFILQ